MQQPLRAWALGVPLSSLIVSAMSCTAPEMKPLICPPPPQPVCSPGTFDKTLLDTVFHGLGHVQSHVTMLPVPPNSAAEDYAITFIPDANGGNIALITSNQASGGQNNAGTTAQRIFSARFFTTTKFGPLKEVQTGDIPLPIGTAFYSKADHLLYFSAKAPNDDPDDYDLYAATVTVDGDQVALSNVHALTPLNDEGHFDSQPTLDPTGTRIYFVSDREGGDGGTDIWFSERTSATSSDWIAPQPLPEPVNSACDELSPFILASDPNTLYFASNGHETVGGYDLFKTHITNGRSAGSLLYSVPENLGKPINTISDEVFPSALNDTAFFWSSNAPASVSGMNLYTITRTLIPKLTAHGEIPEPERIDVNHLQQDTAQPASPTVPPTATIPEQTSPTPQPTLAAQPATTQPPPAIHPVEILAHITRGADNRPATGAEFYIRKDSQELYHTTVPKSGTVSYTVHSDSVYDVGAETEEAFFDVQHIDLRGTNDSVVSVHLHLPDTLVIRINFPFDDYEHPYEYTIDENGQASTATWQHVLDLTAHSTALSMGDLKELILIGHTDSLGTDAYNNRLGFERATFVANELEKRGIPKAIMRVKSVGRTEPVSRRPDESDEIFRLRSRRVEFIKVFK